MNNTQLNHLAFRFVISDLPSLSEQIHSKKPNFRIFDNLKGHMATLLWIVRKIKFEGAPPIFLFEVSIHSRKRFSRVSAFQGPNNKDFFSRAKNLNDVAVVVVVMAVSGNIIK